MKPTSARTIDLFFKTEQGRDIVTLGVKNGMHAIIMKAISNSLVSSTQAIIAVADVDNNRFVNNNIYKVTITNGASCVMRKAVTTAHFPIKDTPSPFNHLFHSPSAMTICNTHATTYTAFSLWLTDITGKDIQSTGDYAAEAESTTIVAATLNIDDGSGGDAAPTSDKYLNERIFKSDGTFFGECTAFADSGTDTLTFRDGLENDIANNDLLYTGNRYHILSKAVIPPNSTLKLDTEELSFPVSRFRMYGQLGSGELDIMFRY